jgi:Glyoxalase-like domain
MASLKDIVVDPGSSSSWSGAQDGEEPPAAEIIRLVGLGARVTAEQKTLTVLEDPEGNEFCLLS